MSGGKWMIEQGDGWYPFEEDRLSRQGGNETDVFDNAAVTETILVDQRGRPLLIRQPRPFGFRPPVKGEHA